MSFDGSDMTAGLQFDEAKHEYRVDGKRLPSVTELMVGALNFAGASEAALELARQRGSAVHKANELDLRGQLFEPSVVDEVAPYLHQFRLWRKAVNYRPIGIEWRGFSARYGYAGTIDSWGAMDSTPEYCIDLFDWKATAALSPVVEPQTSGYERILAEYLQRVRVGRPIRIRRFALHLRPDSYRMVPLTSPDAWPMFAAALTVRRFFDVHRITRN